jgi:hypothetical protein
MNEIKVQSIGGIILVQRTRNKQQMIKFSFCMSWSRDGVQL